MTKPDKFRLDALDRGKVSQSAAVVTAGGAVRGAWVYPKRVEAAFDDLDRNPSTVDLAALVNGQLDQHFFNEGALYLYDLSWLLVEYLMNGDAGKHREAFRKWAGDAGAERSAETLAAAIGMPVEELGKAMRGHAKQIR